MRAHLVAALGAIVLELLRDGAQAVALLARGVERARLLVEQRLLLRRFRLERPDLRAADGDALRQVAEVQLRLLQERAEALHFPGQ